MISRFVHRRTVWWPTFLGWALLFVVVGGAILLWWLRGEAFMSLTERQPAEVLVVEGWIGSEGVKAAAAEFARGGYRYVIATGGMTHARWSERQWSYTEITERALSRSGVPQDRIIAASTLDTEGQRTYEMATATWRALHEKGIQPQTVNVVTLGAHARRSRLVFAKVFGSGTKVGVISWIPPDYKNEPWWQSSERAEDLLKETVGYLFEVLLNSGRNSNSPAAHPR